MPACRQAGASVRHAPRRRDLRLAQPGLARLAGADRGPGGELGRSAAAGRPVGGEGTSRWAVGRSWMGAPASPVRCAQASGDDARRDKVPLLTVAEMASRGRDRVWWWRGGWGRPAGGGTLAGTQRIVPRERACISPGSRRLAQYFRVAPCLQRGPNRC
eukprot:scaffold3031_cov393-Prasinococcus_capsulatus_cf.AAC.6